MAVRFVVLVLVSVLALGGLFFALRPAPPETAPQERTVSVEIRAGGMEPAEISVRKGDRVSLTISADRAVELHVHGYDLEEAAEPGNPAKLSFKADLTGRFPIENHDTEEELGVLVVKPR